MREFEWFGDKEKKGFDPHSGLLVPEVDDPHLYADGHFYAIRGTYIHQLSQIPLDLLRNWISEGEEIMHIQNLPNPAPTLPQNQLRKCFFKKMVLHDS